MHLETRIQIRHQAGFSMLEVMIVLAIVGILSAIAIPSYQESVRKSHRSDAKISLVEATQSFERCFSEHGQYQYHATNAPNCPQYSNTASSSGYYSLTVTHASTTTFSLAAQAPSTSAQYRDLNCRSFTVTQTGIKTSKNSSAGASTDCW